MTSPRLLINIKETSKVPKTQATPIKLEAFALSCSKSHQAPEETSFLELQSCPPHHVSMRIQRNHGSSEVSRQGSDLDE